MKHKKMMERLARKQLAYSQMVKKGFGDMEKDQRLKSGGFKCPGSPKQA